MITIKKLKTLKDNTRYRKYIIILQTLENEIKEYKNINTVYYNEILNEIVQEKNLPLNTQQLAGAGVDLRNINNLRHSIMKYLNIEPSEWDFTSPSDNLINVDDKLGINIYLDDIRSPFNLGSIFRTGVCFGASKIILSKDSTSPTHTRAKRTAMGCIDLIEWEVSEIEKLTGPVFALELGGVPIDEFKFPKEGTVIVGNEELGISPDALKIADNSLGRVTIPLIGGKSSLNVANATSILLQRWYESLLKS